MDYEYFDSKKLEQFISRLEKLLEAHDEDKPLPALLSTDPDMFKTLIYDYEIRRQNICNIYNKYFKEALEFMWGEESFKEIEENDKLFCKYEEFTEKLLEKIHAETFHIHKKYRLFKVLNEFLNPMYDIWITYAKWDASVSLEEMNDKTLCPIFMYIKEGSESTLKVRLQHKP